MPGRVSTLISRPWSKWPKRLLRDSRKGPLRLAWKSKRKCSGRSSLARRVGGTARWTARRVPWRFAAGGSNRASQWPIAPTVVEAFSPQRPLLRLDGHGYSPALLQAIVSAGAQLPSFENAAFALSLAGLSISARHVQELTEQVGTELTAVRDAKAQQRRQRQLQPEVALTPQVVAAEVDGGRLRTRAGGCGRGVHEKENREDKIACLVTLHSPLHAADPQPEPAPSFVKPRRIQRLVQQMHRMTGSESGPQTTENPAPDEAIPTPDTEAWAPRRLVRTCVASLKNSAAFGPMMAGEAQARDFYAAPRRAFVADGQAYNWTIHRGYFPDFVPIVDFLHVICYLYTAAHVSTRDESQRWPQYLTWLRACWQGRVADVVADLEQEQAALGRPPPGEELATNDPRRVIAEALSYVSNNAERMDYPRYRQLGLPTTSSLVESLVGEFNARVKAPNKFWNRPDGAEAILQVRAALLSEDGRLERHFATRPGSPYRRRTAA